MRIRGFLLSLITLTLIYACDYKLSHEKPREMEQMARSDSIPAVSPVRETLPVSSFGDAADDPAIWHTAVGNTLILGTDKKSGLNVYSMTGDLRQFLAIGRVNNVDIAGSLAVATNRTTRTLDVLKLGKDEEVSKIASYPLPFPDPYGVCAFRREGLVHVFAGDKSGRLQYRALSELGVLVDEREEDVWKFESQTEGCVISPTRSLLFVGEEEKGIHVFDINGPNLAHLKLLTHESLNFDIEGLTIYDRDQSEFLVVSSQGDSTFVIFELPTLSYRLKFAIQSSKDGAIDGVTDTDGLAASGRNILGFPLGLLVVQDGSNTRPKEKQNFKVIDWRDIDDLLVSARTNDWFIPLVVFTLLGLGLGLWGQYMLTGRLTLRFTKEKEDTQT